MTNINKDVIKAFKDLVKELKKEGWNDDIIDEVINIRWEYKKYREDL